VPPRATRPPELEDVLNARIYHPLSDRLAALLAATPVTPNMVSICGALLVALAAWFYLALEAPASVLLGFLAHASWHVLDGADGTLARLTGRASPIGELVDGICDYAGHGILYIAFAMTLDDTMGVWAWVLGWAAAISRAIQANHSESGRRTYLWRVYGVPWLKQAVQGDDTQLQRPSLRVRIGAILGRFYVAVAGASSPLADRVNARVEAAKGNPAAEAQIRAACRAEAGITLRLQMVLGANWRTLMLGASMALGSPLWFWLAEVTAMNLLLLVSVRLHEASDRRILARTPLA
jgi:hypothetical protein